MAQVRQSRGMQVTRPRNRKLSCPFSFSDGDTSWNHLPPWTLPRVFMSIPSSLPARGSFRWPGFCTVQERRTDREPGLCGDASVSPPGSPEGLQDGGCMASASVWVWMLRFSFFSWGSFHGVDGTNCTVFSWRQEVKATTVRGLQ